MYSHGLPWWQLGCMGLLFGLSLVATLSGAHPDAPYLLGGSAAVVGSSLVLRWVVACGAWAVLRSTRLTAAARGVCGRSLFPRNVAALLSRGAALFAMGSFCEAATMAAARTAA